MPVLKNSQHETLAYWLAAGRPLKDAYELANYRKVGRTHKRGDVQDRVTELKSQISEKMTETLAWSQGQVMSELVRNVSQAREGWPIFDKEGNECGRRPDFAAVNRALELYGKQLGMFKETLLTGTADDRMIDAMDDEEVAILAEAHGRIEQHRRYKSARTVPSDREGAAEGEASHLPALPEAAGVSRDGGAEAGEDAPRREPGREDLECGDGAGDARDGEVPGVVEGEALSGPDQGVVQQHEQRDDAG